MKKMPEFPELTWKYIEPTLGLNINRVNIFIVKGFLKKDREGVIYRRWTEKYESNCKDQTGRVLDHNRKNPQSTEVIGPQLSFLDACENLLRLMINDKWEIGEKVSQFWWDLESEDWKR